MVTAELNIKISKMSELFSVRPFQYFISSFFFVVFRFQRVLFLFLYDKIFSLLFLFATKLQGIEGYVYVEVSIWFYFFSSLVILTNKGTKFNITENIFNFRTKLNKFINFLGNVKVYYAR